MPFFLNDLRHGLRTLLKTPGFTCVALLTLGLGIGANTAVFSIVNALFLRPLPVKDPGKIVVLANRQNHGALSPAFAIADERDIRAETTGALADVFGYQVGLDGLSVGRRAERVFTNYVTGNYFQALGLKPALGRLIRPEEGQTPGKDPVVVLGYGYWRDHLGSDKSVVGSKVSINGQPVTVVGIAPEGFHGTYPSIGVQAFLPVGMAITEGYPPDWMQNRALRGFSVLARLRNGTDLRQAQAAVNVAAARLSRENPQVEKGLSIEVFPELKSRPEPEMGETARVAVVLFLGLSALVLLLACVNVANFLLVRATVRQREMAIRTALGASQQALIRQVLTESLLLGLMGGLAGMLLGYWASSSLSSLQLQTDLPVLLNFGFDWRVFSYALAGAVVTGLVVGLAPAMRASSINLNQVLHNGGRGTVGGGHRMRNILVTVQVAGALTILIIAGLFTRSLAAVEHLNLGFNPEHLLNFGLDPSEIGYNEAQGQAFFKDLRRRVEGIPGVSSASFAGVVPMGYYGDNDRVLIAGREKRPNEPDESLPFNVVTPGYFSTMGTKLLRGRAFSEADGPAAYHTAVISQTMADHFWPKQEAIGREFQIGSEKGQAIRVVGIAADVRFRGTGGPLPSFFYVPLAQHYATNSLQTLQVRYTGNQADAIREVEHAIRLVAPTLPIFDVKSMRQALYTLNGLLMFQIGAGLAAALGGLGLVLAVVGVYGVISYSATQRTHEIGLRMALGAQPLNILQLMFRNGLLIIAAGVIVGLALTLACAQVLGSYLVVSPTDPVTYVTVTGLLMSVALLACFVPARRAMRVDPMVALRCD